MGALRLATVCEGPDGGGVGWNRVGLSGAGYPTQLGWGWGGVACGGNEVGWIGLGWCWCWCWCWCWGWGWGLGWG